MLGLAGSAAERTDQETGISANKSSVWGKPFMTIVYSK
jgi:hypothetical protein